MRTIWLLAVLAVGCENARQAPQPPVAARKAAYAAQCVAQGGDPSVGSDEVVCTVANGIRWRIKL